RRRRNYKSMKSISRTILTVLLALCTAALAANDGAKKDDPAKDEKKAKSHTVEMDDKKYEPAKLTIKVGEAVVWDNVDDHDHTVIADDKSFKSGNISPGDTYEFTFKKVGTYKYACKYHPRMKGTIVVEKGS
ncbi:MAG: cupredoxin family copper-binding protein, partial [Tepidisphaeraceae bacterium]